MAVHSALRPGLDERIYENALVVEMREKGIPFDQQKQFPVVYKSVPVGTLIPDLIVDDLVVVDTKVVEDFNQAHISQMLGYLNITSLSVGLLINFKHTSLKWKRIINEGLQSVQST